jgi:hypothetical protein
VFFSHDKPAPFFRSSLYPRAFLAQTSESKGRSQIHNSGVAVLKSRPHRPPRSNP